jgi:hypothetical protein
MDLRRDFVRCLKPAESVTRDERATDFAPLTECAPEPAVSLQSARHSIKCASASPAQAVRELLDVADGGSMQFRAVLDHPEG